VEGSVLRIQGTKTRDLLIGVLPSFLHDASGKLSFKKFRCCLLGRFIRTVPPVSDGTCLHSPRFRDLVGGPMRRLIPFRFVQ
jgi:hypothetical protein